MSGVVENPLPAELRVAGLIYTYISGGFMTSFLFFFFRGYVCYVALGGGGWSFLYNSLNSGGLQAQRNVCIFGFFFLLFFFSLAAFSLFSPFPPSPGPLTPTPHLVLHASLSYSY